MQTGMLWRAEWRLLRAERAPWLLVLVFLAVTAYGAWNGWQWSRFQGQTIAELQRSDGLRLAGLDSLLRRADVDSAVTVPPAGALGATGATRHAVLSVPPLGAMAVGTSDLHPYYARVSIRSKSSFMATDELENPHNLLAGRFDLVFVVVYVMPLLLIALTYNTVPAERDQGTMALWRAQPIDAARVLRAKLGVRVAFVGVTVICALAAAAVALGVPVGELAVLWRLLCWLAAVLCYLVFWAGVLLLINTVARTSPSAAVMALGTWLLIVVIIPASVAAVVSARYPAPSRVALTTAAREASDRAAAEGDAAVGQFLADHPEMLRTGTLAAPNAWGRTIAVQERSAAALVPVYTAFDEALARQHRAAAAASLLSPAVIVQDVLHDLADRGTARFRAFDAAIDTHHRDWQAFFFTRVFADQRFRSADLSALPRFRFQEFSTSQLLAANSGRLLAILLPGLLIAAVGWRRLRGVPVHQ